MNKAEWSSSLSILKKGESKKELDKRPVLDRMELQLQESNIPTKYTKNIDLKWAKEDTLNLIKKYTNRNYILVFPFCSKKHKNKKWPFFSELISKIRREFKNHYSVLIAPGPDEIQAANELNANVVLNDGKPINIKMLISLIDNSKFVVANDTGPAHIASHFNKKGLVLFGNHTSPEKVSIESKNFKALSAKKLSDLSVESVIHELKKNLN